MNINKQTTRLFTRIVVSLAILLPMSEAIVTAGDKQLVDEGVQTEITIAPKLDYPSIKSTITLSEFQEILKKIRDDFDRLENSNVENRTLLKQILENKYQDVVNQLSALKGVDEDTLELYLSQLDGSEPDDSWILWIGISTFIYIGTTVLFLACYDKETATWHLPTFEQFKENTNKIGSWTKEKLKTIANS